MKLNHPSKHSELTNVQFELFGRYMVEWSNAEFLLGNLLTRLLITPPFLGRSYTDHLSGNIIHESILEAIKIHEARYRCTVISKKILSEAKDISGTIHSKRKFRNNIAHYCWFRKNDNEIFGTGFSGGIPSIKPQKRDYIVIKVSKLKSEISQLTKAVKKLRDFFEKLPEFKEENICHALKQET